MISEHTVGFERPTSWRKIAKACAGALIKLKRVVAKLPFAEDLLSAYYCAFDKETRATSRRRCWEPSPIYLPFDFLPDMLPVLGFTRRCRGARHRDADGRGHITPEHRTPPAPR